MSDCEKLIKASHKKLAARGKVKTGSVSMATSGGIPRISRWLAPVLIVLLTFVAFFPVLQNGFVGWDDDRNLFENPNYRGLGWAQLRWMFTTFYFGHYRPLTWVTLGLDYLLWGMNPFGYHLTSLLLHAVNAVLFYFVTLRLLRVAMPAPAVSGEFLFRAAAGSAALLFSLHPLRVEPVAWASARNDVLSGLFFLWSILCYLRANTVAKTDASRWRWMTAAVIIYGLSLLSKAIGMTLPFVLLVLDIYPLRRLKGVPVKWFGSAARNVWWEKIPFLLLALWAGATGLVTKQEAGAVIPFAEYGVVERVSQSLFGLAFYLWKTVIPLGLSPLYELPSDFNLWDWPFVLSGIMVAAISLGLFFARRQWPAGFACWVCYVVVLLPVLGIVQSGPQLAADRYTYLSCLGWAILPGAGALYSWKMCLGNRMIWGRFAIAAGLIVIAVGMAVLTWKQAQVWGDSETLWRHVLAVTEESNFKSKFAHNNVGNIETARGNLDQAIGHFRQALLIDSDYVKANYNLANALAKKAEFIEAIAHYRQALRIDPDNAEAHNNLGNVLALHGNLEEAIQHFRHALRLNPGISETHFNLGNALVGQGDFKQAMEHFQQAVKIKPDFAEAYQNLGRVMAAQGDLDKAIDHFRQALRIQPEYAEAHESLGRALAQQGKREEAVKSYQEALRIMKSRREASGPR